jgi:hypothetical protein
MCCLATLKVLGLFCRDVLLVHRDSAKNGKNAFYGHLALSYLELNSTKGLRLDVYPSLGLYSLDSELSYKSNGWEIDQRSNTLHLTAIDLVNPIYEPIAHIDCCAVF